MLTLSKGKAALVAALEEAGLDEGLVDRVRSDEFDTRGPNEARAPQAELRGLLVAELGEDHDVVGLFANGAYLSREGEFE
jgi:hypothetical protein